jgi:hypothetical protein
VGNFGAEAIRAGAYDYDDFAGDLIFESGYNLWEMFRWRSSIWLTMIDMHD